MCVCVSVLIAKFPHTSILTDTKSKSQLSLSRQTVLPQVIILRVSKQQWQRTYPGYSPKSLALAAQWVLSKRSPGRTTGPKVLTVASAQNGALARESNNYCASLWLWATSMQSTAERRSKRSPSAFYSSHRSEADEHTFIWPKCNADNPNTKDTEEQWQFRNTGHGGGRLV